MVGLQRVGMWPSMRPALVCGVSANLRVSWGFHLAFLKLVRSFVEGILGILNSFKS